MGSNSMPGCMFSPLPLWLFVTAVLFIITDFLIQLMFYDQWSHMLKLLDFMTESVKAGIMTEMSVQLRGMIDNLIGM